MTLERVRVWLDRVSGAARHREAMAEIEVLRREIAAQNDLIAQVHTLVQQIDLGLVGGFQRLVNEIHTQRDAMARVSQRVDRLGGDVCIRHGDLFESIDKIQRSLSGLARHSSPVVARAKAPAKTRGKTPERTPG